MQNLSDFSKNNSSTFTSDSSNQNSNLNIMELLTKYGGKSQNELINEFYKLVDKQKKEGTFDKNKIVNIASAIMPFLNSEQKNLVSNILNKV